jgi:hypothetical protein
MTSDALEQKEAAVEALLCEIARREIKLGLDDVDDDELKRQLREQEEKLERNDGPAAKDAIILKRINALNGEINRRLARGGMHVDWRLMSTKNLKKELRRLKALLQNQHREYASRLEPNS